MSEVETSAATPRALQRAVSFASVLDAIPVETDAFGTLPPMRARRSSVVDLEDYEFKALPPEDECPAKGTEPIRPNVVPMSGFVGNVVRRFPWFTGTTIFLVLLGTVAALVSSAMSYCISLLKTRT